MIKKTYVFSDGSISDKLLLKSKSIFLKKDFLNHSFWKKSKKISVTFSKRIDQLYKRFKI
jgi:hypothetical protein